MFFSITVGSPCWSRSKNNTQITHSVRVRAATPPLCSILLLHTPRKHLTHEQPAQSTTLSNLDALGEPCRGACTPHLLEVSCHYGVVVKCFASGQCGPGLFPGQRRSWSRHLQSSKSSKIIPTNQNAGGSLFNVLLVHLQNSSNQLKGRW